MPNFNIKGENYKNNYSQISQNYPDLDLLYFTTVYEPSPEGVGRGASEYNPGRTNFNNHLVSELFKFNSF